MAHLFAHDGAADFMVCDQNRRRHCDAFEVVLEAENPITIVGKQPGERMGGEVVVAVDLRVLVSLRQALLLGFGADL